MSDDQAAKVIQFPGRSRDQKASDDQPVAAAPAAAKPTMPPKSKNSLLSFLPLFAITLASVAANRFAFSPAPATSGARGIASANLELDRDAAWEKLLAERLAKPGSVGAAAYGARSASLVDQLRFATLADRYHIDLGADGSAIRAIVPIGGAPEGAMLTDRLAFLRTFGRLFDPNFARVELKAVDRAATGTTEAYELSDGEGRVRVRAVIEITPDQKLVSVRAVQI